VQNTPLTIVLDRSTLAEIEMKIEQGKRNAVSRLFHAKNDKEVIAGWKSDLSRVLHIFNVRSRWFCVGNIDCLLSD
jgi:hypothetical protein